MDTHHRAGDGCDGAPSVADADAGGGVSWDFLAVSGYYASVISQDDGTIRERCV